MQISIEVISVGSVQTVPTKNGKSYQCVEVAYRKDGKIEGKKIMSFVNPAVFKAVQNLTQGEVVTITTEKGEPNAQGQSYWQWTEVGAAGAAPPAQQSAAATGGGTTKSTGTSWETKEERAAKQVMIVRQSSLSTAVALANAVGDKKSSANSIIRVAQEFEAYVMDTSPPATTKEIGSFDDMENDIPL
jgi:hypothetical protein